ncbi:proline racemase family protein [Desulforapulum autotrophicum]|nr:proline racemase family protein [Desulforapulum autotrophicum]
MITTVDSHTAGEPTRIITGGLPHISGKDMPAKKEWMQQNMDDLRRMLMWEPRGHQDMFGAVITSPVSPDADAGVIFMDGGGYLDMCGHGSIGAVTVLLETGMVTMDSKTGVNEKTVIIDTPAGKILARAVIENKKVTDVTIRNVPAFFYDTVELDLPEIGRTPIDISYGGNFFALVAAEHLQTTVEPKNIDQLRQWGLTIRDQVNQITKIFHPGTGNPAQVKLVEIYEKTVPPRNIVVFGSGQIDRSPCGTGTSAKMALLHSRGQLKIGEPYEYQSIFGTAFRGRIVDTLQVGDKSAIVPEITGRAHITGIHQFVVEDDDPFKCGFNINTNP